MPEIIGVRDYNRVRKYLERIYLYGFFNRTDFARMGIGSVKDYDFGTSLIRSMFPESDENAVWMEGQKYLRFQRAYAKSGENRMADSYLLFAMDAEKELVELLAILSTLAEAPCTTETLKRRLETYCQEEDTSKYSSARRRAKDLCDSGYVYKSGKEYKLVPAPFKALDNEELDQLFDCVRFFCGVSYPRVAGSFLLRTLEQEYIRRGRPFAQRSPFLLRHSVNRNVFDEEILYQLLDAMEEHRRVTLELEHKGQAEVLPVALRADIRLGRWYLLAQERDSAPFICRVSFIRSLKGGEREEKERWHMAEAAVKKAYKAAGCSGLLPSNGPTLVKAELCFGDYTGMRMQFEREICIGTISVQNGKEYYCAEINDPLELLPFLRSFSPWLRILPGDHGLDTALQEDLRRMRRRLKGVGA
ncbi:MAG: WYL domain-containing protein [Clostridiales bacterium]|uniref:WYL domain-containing protein n=1 Tax=Flavonifractor porci TaxID=3133422 RepID=UPI0030A276A4|nr:WYL domain-containing protein [Clostridiales bacterium]